MARKPKAPVPVKCPRIGCKEKILKVLHTCPYQHDVNNDSEYQCHCCETCQKACAAEV